VYRRSRLIAFALSSLTASPALAVPQLSAPYTDHAVLQRGRPLIIEGQAAAGERLTVSLAGHGTPARADRTGHWSAQLPPLPAGGPYELAVTGANGAVLKAGDIMVGDVWLCSGQSNMELPLSRSINGAAEVEAATDPQLRLLKVPQRPSLTAEPLANVVAWQASTPKSAANFSAACTFMGRQFRDRDKDVAVGLIDSTWGGTAIRSWMPEAAVRATGGATDADVVALYRRDPAAAARKFGETWGEWWRGQSGDAAGIEPWVHSDRLPWEPLPSFTYWEGWGRPDFATYNGGLWARRKVRLTAGQASGPVTLSLGVVDDADTTFINGVLVGATYSWSAPRNYQLAKGTLHAGDNEILVFVRDNYSNGGFQGPADRVKLTFADGTAMPLGTGWEMSKPSPKIGEPPLAPWDGQSGVGTLYEGMIAPLGRFAVEGIAWYQGESDVNKPGYDRRLGAMMASWRAQFGRPDLPFLIVGLAGWGKPVASPHESGWAALIDEQRKAVAADARAALISAIDIGEWNDLHPPNKQEVGRRLALAAWALRGGIADGRLGPMPLGASRTGGEVRVRFSKHLQSLSGAAPIGFELCGSGSASCRFVSAMVKGDAVLLSGARPGDSRVRYAWADFPIVNLYDADLLPVPVFELPIAQ